MKKLFSLLITFFKIGLFTFGGGYAMLSLIENETVSKKGWLSGEELLNIIAIAESTPGPISINCATYIGYKRAGVLGSIFATFGVVLPSFIIIFAISFFIERFLEIDIVSKAFKGIQAAVAVLIIRAGFKMSKSIKGDAVSLTVFALSLCAAAAINFFSVNFSTIWLILLGGAIGFIYYGLIKKGAKREKITASADPTEPTNQAEIAQAEPSDPTVETTADPTGPTNQAEIAQAEHVAPTAPTDPTEPTTDQPENVTDQIAENSAESREENSFENGGDVTGENPRNGDLSPEKTSFDSKKGGRKS